MELTVKKPKSPYLIAALKIREPWQSLYCLPSLYRDLSKPISDFSTITQEQHDERIFVEGEIREKYGYDGARQPSNSPAPARLVLVIFDGKSTSINCEIYGGTYAWRNSFVGQKLHLLVTVKAWRGQVSFTSPEITSKQPLPRAEYKGIAGKVKGSDIAQTISNALQSSSNLTMAANDLINQYPQLCKKCTLIFNQPDNYLVTCICQIPSVMDTPQSIWQS